MLKKLSIGTAIYNLDESYLREHIEGIQKQLTDETELLLIDDCSTNNSGEVCREYAEADSRIRYIKQDKNGGISLVRNRTIEEAQGKWIFFVDGDDILSDNAVKTILKFCDSDYDIIIHDRLKFFDDRKPAEQADEVNELIELPEGAGRRLSISALCLDPNISDELNLPAKAFFHAAWGAIYSKDFLEKNNLLFPVGQKKAQDAVFNTRAYYHAKRIAYLPYIMYFYRVNQGGITQRYTAELTDVLNSLLGHLENCKNEYYAGDSDVETRFMNHRVMAIVMDNMRLNIFHKNNPKPKEQRKKEFIEFIDSQPYNTAINSFNHKQSGRWEWLLPAKLIKKKKFASLDMFVGNAKAYNLLCGGYKRIAKFFG